MRKVLSIAAALLAVPALAGPAPERRQGIGSAATALSAVAPFEGRWIGANQRNVPVELTVPPGSGPDNPVLLMVNRRPVPIREASADEDGLTFMLANGRVIVHQLSPNALQADFFMGTDWTSAVLSKQR